MDMSKNVKEKISSLAKILEFKLSDDELQKIENEYHEIEKTLALIKTIDTTNVTPTNFVHPITNTPKWRKDEIKTYDAQSVFSNCQSFKNNMVEIKNAK